MTEDELRANRLRLAQVVLDNKFCYKITPQTVSMLDENGFSIGGYMGAKFHKDSGLTVWNKANRMSNPSFTVSFLAKIERELSEVFNDIWKGEQ